ncbi:MmyB family transcriptional regulator [Corynebacterium flavescens]
MVSIPDLANYRKDAVAGFLRTRRARIDPDASSPAFDPVGDRRVAGMRREEVAWAAGISFDYYVKLEQGRMLNPSPSVVNSIMKALRLNALDRRYLSLLFEEEAPFEARTDERDRLNARVTLEEVASHFPEATMRHILDRDLNLVLPDAASKAILFPGNAEAPSELSLVDYMFSRQHRQYSRKVYVDWRDKAAEVIGLVHMKLVTQVASESLVSTVQELLRDPAFRQLWTRYAPFKNTSGSWRIRLRGEDNRFEVRDCPYITVNAAEDPEQSLVTYL